MARLTLKPALLAEIALGSTAFGTRLGTMACHAGEVRALAILIRKMNQSSEAGVTRFSNTIAAKAAERTAVTLS